MFPPSDLWHQSTTSSRYCSHSHHRGLVEWVRGLWRNRLMTTERVGVCGRAGRPVMRLCVRAVISSRCKCFLVQVGPLIYSSKGISINPPLITRLWRARKHVIPPAPPIIAAFAQTRVRRGSFRLNRELLPRPRHFFFMFNRTNVRRAGEVSGSDISRSCMSSACLPAFTPAFIPLFPVCTSHVCSSGA